MKHVLLPLKALQKCCIVMLDQSKGVLLGDSSSTCISMTSLAPGGVYCMVSEGEDPQAQTRAI